VVFVFVYTVSSISPLMDVTASKMMINPLQ